MAKKNAAAKASSPAPPETKVEEPAQQESPVTTVDGSAVAPATVDVSVHDPVQVNNANLTELKIALDDAVKRSLSRPNRFTQNHLHTDVRLALGWFGVVVAIATGLYSWKISFDDSKLGVTVGVGLYMVLSAAQLAYAYFIEKETVFVGKRKILDKRIETELLSASSRTTHPEPRSPALSEKTPLPASYIPKSVYPRKTALYLPPHYKLTLDYTHTAAGGKSLIKKGRIEDERCYADFFDGEGTLNESQFAAWVFALVEAVESQ